MELTNSERARMEEQKDPDNSSQSTPMHQKDQAEKSETKTSALKKIWSAVNMDLPTAMLMFKSVDSHCIWSIGPDHR